MVEQAAIYPVWIGGILEVEVNEECYDDASGWSFVVGPVDSGTCGFDVGGIDIVRRLEGSWREKKWPKMVCIPNLGCIVTHSVVP